MKKALRIILRVVFSRMIIIAALTLLQLFILFATFFWFENYSQYIVMGFTVTAVVVIIYIINSNENPAFKLSWMLPICAFPFFGAFLYLFVLFNSGRIGLRKDVDVKLKKTAQYLKTSEEVKEKLAKEDADIMHLATYLEKQENYPIYDNTKVTYFTLGEEKYKDLLIELEKAEEYIFLEFFIIEAGIMWNSILEILERKAKEGVEVRVMYDATCSICLLPHSYPAQLKRKGMKAKMFSPIKPMLSTHQNNRDHRKILVIDGKVGYTGGVNLADEYINEKVVYGHWKDVAVKIEGEAVKTLLAMFLQMWNVNERKKEDYQQYLCKPFPKHEEAQGYVIPYGDGPTNRENIAENVYIDMLYRAKQYVHIMTPYLILDNELLTALTYAAKRGVDVKLLLPHIPDKKMVFAIARTFYPQLLEAGVKIYEYIPGFVHAKVFVSDDEKAVVGTINLDFRSLFLHFECGVYLYRMQTVIDIEKDFSYTLSKSQQVNMEYYKKIPLLSRMTGRVFRVFGPLM